MKLLPSLMNSGTKKDDNWHSSAPQDTAAWEQHGHALQHFSIASALLTKLQLKKPLYDAILAAATAFCSQLRQWQRCTHGLQRLCACRRKFGIAGNTAECSFLGNKRTIAMYAEPYWRRQCTGRAVRCLACSHHCISARASLYKASCIALMPEMTSISIGRSSGA